ncbi:Uncharacterized protein dnm_010300 [Desulfonema magnum]|uniref:Uncharacterized protein n=1 Tax=Desulfonema magnum TaxID=45655 RepID=A0A975BGM6_9BACT|nr:Uncharacterized protein dnm_010300 [Desulfonema magnum]
MSCTFLSGAAEQTSCQPEEKLLCQMRMLYSDITHLNRFRDFF